MKKKLLIKLVRNCHASNLKKSAVVLLLIFLGQTGLLQAQSNVGETRLTIDIQNKSTTEAMDMIASKSGYMFFFRDQLIEPSKRVSLKVTNETLRQTLDKLFAGTGNTYTIDGKQIFVQKRASASQNPKSEHVVTGIVTDEGGIPLLGANIVVKTDTPKHSITNKEGKFTLTGIDPNAVILVSFIGYETLQYELKGRNNIQVVLKSNTVHLNEVVVTTGYQTVSKERATGSFAIISADKMENKLQPSVKSVLEGQAAGMVLTKDGNIEIRGISTFGNKDPLIVVDGYPLIGNGMGIDFVNPENIESITILKDAVAASIYGSQSSNGVIVITTKSADIARKGNEYFNIDYKGTYGVILKPDLPKLNIAKVGDYMEAEMDLYNQNPASFENTYNSYGRISDYAYLLLAKDKGWMSESEVNAGIEKLKGNNALKEIQDKLVRPKQSQQHNISIASVSDMNKFGAALRYVEEYGHIITDKNSRVTFDINDTWNPKRWLKLRLLSNINYTTAHTPAETYLTLTSFGSTNKILPYSQLYDDNGDMTPFYATAQRKLETYQTYPGMKSVLYHPEQDIPMSYSKYDNLQMRIGSDVTVNFFDFLTGSFGGTWTKGASTSRTVNEAGSFNMRTAYNDGTSKSNSTKHYIPEGGKIDESRSSVETWVVRSQLNYNQSFDNFMHRITAIAGCEIIKDTHETTYLPTRLGYDPVSATYNSGFNPYDYNNNTNNQRGDYLFGINPTNLGTINYGNNYSYNNGIRDKRTFGWYGNASYEYNSRYIVSGSIRWELSNFYGTDPKFRYKPTWSVGGTYKIAEEDYFGGLRDIFSTFNLRATYGVLGSNSLNYTPFLVLSVGNHDATMGGVSYGISSFPNNQLRYEKKNTLDIGLDMSLLDNRVNITLDVYQNKSYDLISNEAIDQTKGTTAVYQNVGEMTNKGLELTMNGRIISRSDFRWNATLIGSFNKTYVDHYNISRMYFSSYATATGLMVQGYSADGLWGGKFAGLSDKGVALYYNKAGDKVEGGSLKAEDAVYLGTLRPTTDLSLTNTFQYKNFELSFMFIAKFGAKYRKDCFSGSNYINRHVAERWRKAGDENNTIYPVLSSWNMDMFYFPYSDVLVGNANYLKLRDLTLSYNLPKTVTDKCKLSGVKFYFQTRNLFYLTAKGVDIDPEIAQLNTSGGTGAMTNQGFTSLQLRPEFYFGVMIKL